MERARFVLVFSLKATGLTCIMKKTVTQAAQRLPGLDAGISETDGHLPISPTVASADLRRLGYRPDGRGVPSLQQ